MSPGKEHLLFTLTLNSDPMPCRFQVLEPRVLDFNRGVGEDVRMHVELSKVAGMVRADSHQLDRVITNLRAPPRRWHTSSGNAGASTLC